MSKYIYIADPDYFEESALKNPICFDDHKISQTYPEFYELEYDLRLCVAKPATKSEKSFVLYNDYRERYGSLDITVFNDAIGRNKAKNVFLNGFHQEHLEYIIPLIKDCVEVLYLFKCPRIKDLSCLSECKNLKCVFIYWNNSLKTLWDMTSNKELKLISFLSCSKIKEISSLEFSSIEYITLDSEDNNGNKKMMLFDTSVFDKMPHLKHLTLVFCNYNIDW